MHLAVCTALEIEYPIRQDFRFRQLFSDPIGHRTKVFSDDEGLGSNAFQCHDGQQVFKRVLHIRSLRRWLSVWNPKETEEGHHMIQSNGSAESKIIAQQLDYQLIAAGMERAWVDGGQPPILSFWRKRIRWTAAVGSKG